MFLKSIYATVYTAILMYACAYANLDLIAWIIIASYGILMIDIFQEKKAPSETITTGLNLIINKIDDVMTRQERLEKAIADLNAGTNDIAADLVRLKDEIAAGNISEESLANLETNIGVLQDLGAAQ